MKIQIIPASRSTSYIWRVWHGGRCLWQGTAGDEDQARAAATLAKKAAERRRIRRWPLT